MATVYKAYDTRGEREVAVKIIRSDMFGSTVLERIYKRFEREARSLAKLAHPNIVKVIEFGEHEDSPFLVMEYIPGGTLKQKLGKPISWPVAFELLIPVANALNYAHKNKIIHRDVKPSNILIDVNNKPKLTDFGIAKILESDEGSTLATTTGVGIGTPEYMAPEQGMGRPVDSRADIYSLGIVLYEMLTGRKPFRADTPLAVVIKHLNDPLPRPSQFNRDIPESVEKLLFKSLAKKTEDRYQSMAQFEDAMGRLLDENKIKVSRETQKTKNLERTQEAKKLAAIKRKEQLSKAANSLKAFGLPLTLLIMALLSATIGAFNNYLNFQPLDFFQTNTPTPSTTPTGTNTTTATLTRTPTSTPSLTPTPFYTEGNTLYQEDFQERDLGRVYGLIFSSAILGISNPETYWNVQEETNGNRYLAGNVDKEDETGFNFGDKTWSNYALTLRFKVLKQGTDVNLSGIGIYFRNSDIQGCSHGYQVGLGKWWFLGFDQYTKQQDGKCQYVNFQHLVHDNPKYLTLNKWYFVRLELFAHSIKLFMDDTLIYVINNSEIPNGGANISISNGAQTLIDDILVKELLLK